MMILFERILACSFKCRTARCTILVICLAFAFLTEADDTHAQTWTKTYELLNESSSKSPSSIIQTVDGGYLVTAYGAYPGFGYASWLLRLRNDGTILWEKRYHGLSSLSNIHIYSVQEIVSDAGFALAGTTEGGVSGTDIWVARLNSSGGVLWQKSYGDGTSDNNESGYSISTTSDGGFVVSGSRRVSSQDVGDAWVLRLDSSDGRVIWQKTYNVTAFDIANSIQQTTDGGFIVACYAEISGSPGSLILKLKADGSIDWKTPISGGVAQSIRQTSDDGYVFTGYTSSSGAGLKDLWVVRLTSFGSIDWQKTFGSANNDEGKSIGLTADGKYSVAGVFDSNTSGIPGKALGLVLDRFGTLVWKRIYNLTGEESRASSLLQTSDNSYIMAADRAPGVNQTANVWILKLDESGYPAPSCNFFAEPPPSLSDSSATVPVTVVSESVPPLVVTPSSVSVSGTSATVTEQCSDFNVFSLNCIPSYLAVDAGSNATSACTVQTFNFSGSIALSCQGQPLGTSCGLTPDTITIGPNSSSTSTMSVSVSPGAVSGIYPLEVHGTGGTISKTFNTTLEITKLDPEPNPVLFGDIPLGQSSAQDVTVTNIHTSSIDFAGVSNPSGPFSIVSNTCTGSLGPGNSCIIRVKFAPTEQQASNGSFTVATTIGGSVTVQIQGNGVTPQILVSILAANGGESWTYSADAQARSEHLLAWESTSYFPIRRTRLWYTTDYGVANPEWTCIADSGDVNLPDTDCSDGCCNRNYTGSDTLEPNASVFRWEMPTSGEASNGNQRFPSAASRIKVEITDTYYNNGESISQNNFYIIQPTTSSVRTLILWHPGRIATKYGVTARDTLKSKLQELAQHSKVSGVLLPLDVLDPTAYGDWTADPTDQNKANAVARQIWNYLYEPVNGQVTKAYTNTQYLILVGDDFQIPFYRMRDGASIYLESSYPVPGEGGLSLSATTVGSALSADMFLTDNFYSERKAEASGLPNSDGFVYLNDLYLGRLVETPTEIEGVINTFLAQNGQLNVTTDTDKILVTAHDFLYDSGFDIKNNYKANLIPNGLTRTDCLLDDPDASGNTDCVDKLFNATDLESQLFATTAHRISNINTHANHFNFATSAGFLSTAQMAANPSNLTGTVLYTSGCHSGLPVPPLDINNQPVSNNLDLPELMAQKKVVAYIANTGYGWGMRHGIGLTERLMQLITDQILESGSIQIGKAMADAKREYYIQERRYDVFDEKVVHELSLFGLPNYLVVTDAFRSSAPAQEKLPTPEEEADSGCAQGICLQKQFTTAQTSTVRQALPIGITELNLSFTFGAYTYACTDDGQYYKLNNLASGETGASLQPHLVYDSRLSGTQAHGVLLVGGAYSEKKFSPCDPSMPPSIAFNPVIAVPRSTNANNDEGGIPGRQIVQPIIILSASGSSSLRESREAITPASFTSLVVDTGYYDSELATEFLFDDMRFTMYYSNSADYDPPGITGPGPFHSTNGQTTSFSVNASDPYGIYRVLITYKDTATNQWTSLDLSFSSGDPLSGNGTWQGSLTLPNSFLYFVQAIDKNGNVRVFSETGQDQYTDPTDGQKKDYGSSWEEPKVFTVLDTAAPPAPVVSSPGNGSNTSNHTPSLNGTAEAFSTVTIYIDGAPAATAAANGSGNWTFASGVLSDGTHTVDATATDAAGNTSPASSANLFTVYTIALLRGTVAPLDPAGNMEAPNFSPLQAFPHESSDLAGGSPPLVYYKLDGNSGNTLRAVKTGGKIVITY